MCSSTNDRCYTSKAIGSILTPYCKIGLTEKGFKTTQSIACLFSAWSVLPVRLLGHLGFQRMHCTNSLRHVGSTGVYETNVLHHQDSHWILCRGTCLHLGPDSLLQGSGLLSAVAPKEITPVSEVALCIFTWPLCLGMHIVLMTFPPVK